MLLSKTNGTKENFFLDLFYSGTDTKEDTFLSVNNLQLVYWQQESVYYIRLELKLNHVSLVVEQVLIQSVRLLSHVQLFTTPWTATHQSSLSITNSRSLLKLMSFELVVPSNHIILWNLLLSVFSSIRVFCFFVCFCFNWRVITLQYCSGFAIQWHESAMGIHVFPILNPPSHLPPHPIPLGRPSAPALSTLSHALNLEWWSVSHMIMYVFPCYFLKSSHPRLLPQSLKDFYTRVIVTISKFCIYALVYCIGVYLSGLLTLHNGPQFHWPR